LQGTIYIIINLSPSVGLPAAALNLLIMETNNNKDKAATPPTTNRPAPKVDKEKLDASKKTHNDAKNNQKPITK